MQSIKGRIFKKTCNAPEGLAWSPRKRGFFLITERLFLQFTVSSHLHVGVIKAKFDVLLASHNGSVGELDADKIL